MELFTIRDIVEATNGTLVSGNMQASVYRVSTDSRNINEGDLFIPIEGEKFDGHDFIEECFSKGAAAAITHKNFKPHENKIVIKVDNTLKALGKLAWFYKKKFDIPFVAITGSVGKTSTKDMISSVLNQKFNVLKTKGNFNNEIGLPLTIFNLKREHEAAVIEMGMSGFGEISRLTSIVEPQIAVITNIGLSHIEKLGSRQNILKAKMEILEGLGTDGLVILNGDDSLLYGVKDLIDYRTVFFGMEDEHDYQAFNIKSLGEKGTSFEISLGDVDYKIHVPVPGVHNVYNALAAIAAGVELGMEMEEIIEGISKYESGSMRLNIINHNGIKFINDAYNASPNSMEAAIDVLRDIGREKRTIAVLGDMLEMGDWAAKAHEDVGKFAVLKGIDYIIAIGDMGRLIGEGAKKAGGQNVFNFENNCEAYKFLIGFLKHDDVVLFKASRGMKLEEIVDGLVKDN